ncbi:MAG: hypothetical protein Kow00109_27040 [Acidobacteriota bacterium]
MRWEQWVRQVLGRKVLQKGEPLLYFAAGLWRRSLHRTRFVLVTGSLGKTTTKELLRDILSTRYRVFASWDSQNARGSLALNVLRVRPWHEVAVIEAGTFRPGFLARAGALVRPNLAILTAVARPHWSSFRSLEAIAEEKKSILQFVAPGGMVVVNGDEPRFGDVGERGAFAVLRVGSDPTATLVCEAVETWTWPDRLALWVREGETRFRVQTRLLGKHWVPSVLCALAAGRALGVPLEDAVGALAQTPPYPGRMQPVRVPGGAVIVRDDLNGCRESFETALEVFRAARAKRRILVLGDFSDETSGGPKKRLRKLGRQAAGVGEMLIFVGEHAHHGVDGALLAGANPSTVREFVDLRRAAAFLATELREGDLVLLKGRGAEHLSRVAFAMAGEVRCWVPRCGFLRNCDRCWRLGLSVEALQRLEPL